MRGRVDVFEGDSREKLQIFRAGEFDACVTDPPYALVSIGKRFGAEGASPAKSNGASGVYARATAGFMGQKWDTGETAFDPAFWSEVLRVLKPGAHLVAFGGTRTYHRLACAIEDAGFEIRDMVAWLYGSGFPKSHDVAKGIAKRRDEDEPEVRKVCRFVRRAMDSQGLKSRHLTRHFGNCNARLIDHWAARDSDSQPSLPTPEQWKTLKRILKLDDEMDEAVERLNERKGTPSDNFKNAPVIGEIMGETPGLVGKRFSHIDRKIRDLSSDPAARWAGWGTALKPALEPVVLARKPLVGTVAATVMAHGTGAINVDGCRIATSGEANPSIARHQGAVSHLSDRPARDTEAEGRMASRQSPEAFRAERAGEKLGRWPANVVHDGSGEVTAAFPGEAGAAAPASGPTHAGPSKSGSMAGAFAGMGDRAPVFHADFGSAARFFYCAKADKADRLGSKHPTVKPVDLMAWLCRLVTPPGGVVLDPFAGSGTTGMACLREGFSAVLIEREARFVADIRRRLAHVQGADTPLFQEAAE